MPITNYDDMKQKKARIIDLLMNLAQEIDNLKCELGLSVNGDVLIDLKKRLENDNFKVLIIGEFKNGKSTFINALLGDKILPAYSTPCTAVINEVKYGDNKRAVLYFKNPIPERISEDILPEMKQYIKKYEGKKIPPVSINVSQLVNYVAIPNKYTDDQAAAISELPYSKVVLEYPVDICRDGLEIIDSPGLNENGTRTKVTEEYLDRADAIIYVFRCPKIGGINEMDYIKHKIQTRGYKDIFFICNAINQVDKDEQQELVDFAHNKLDPETSFGAKGVFFVDAKGALDAKILKDMGKYSMTGMKEFEDNLSEYLRNNKGRAKLIQIIEPCRNFIKGLKEQQIKSYIKVLNQKSNDLEKKIKDAKPKLIEAEGKKNTVSKKIALSMDQLKKKIIDSIDNKYGSIIANVPNAVDKFEIDNYMTANIFKQKERKEALEREVISKIDKYINEEMSSWIKFDLSNIIKEHIDRLEKEIGGYVDIFYKNLDEFRYCVSDVKKPKEISGLDRVTATILGTIVGGPTYGVLGATIGIGEMAKRSAITVGAAFAVGAIAAFTPIGIASYVTATTVATITSGVVQIATGGKALTKKYKKQLTNNFIYKLNETRDESCNTYASNIVDDIKSKFALIEQALDNEINIEKSKIESLINDKKLNEKDKKNKLNKLMVIEDKISEIEKELESLSYQIQ